MPPPGRGDGLPYRGLRYNLEDRGDDMSTLSIRLPERLDEFLAEEARLSRRNRSELVREAIAEYLERQKRERFMAEMVAAARALARHGDEAVAIAEEFLPLENEALDLAEGREPGEPWPEESERWWEE